MKFINVTKLSSRATAIVREIEEKKEEVIITKLGKPVVKMHFISESAFSVKENEKEE